MSREQRTEIIRTAIAQFPDWPSRTIAKYILFNWGILFDGNLEAIRSAVRYQLGASGQENRKEVREPLKRTAPVSLPKTWRRSKHPYKLKPGTWLILSDPHIPFHEPKAIEAAVQYGKDKGITGTLLNGDVMDCAAIGFWISVIKQDFDQEIMATIDFLDWLRQELPGELIYKPANHEYRLPNMFAAKVPNLLGAPLAAMDLVLGLEKKGIEFLDYKQMVMAGKLPIFHGHEFQRIDRAVNPARGLFLRAKMWAACAHCHTTSQHTAKNALGVYLTTWSFGCLCDLNPDYNPFGNDWNWGVGIVNVETNGDFEVENRRILSNGKVV
jgi:hypothetical protein